MEYQFLNDVIPDLEFVTNKEKSAKSYFTYFLSRCLRMFEYKNLPDTIPAEFIDKYLFLNGVACIGRDSNGDLRVFRGNWGGEQDPYYRPSKFIVSNPHISGGWTHEFQIFETKENSQLDGVLLRNDTSWYGLSPMLSRYSCLMAENILTLRVADVMLRITALLSAPSDTEYRSATEYITALENGELKVIAENAFFDGIKLQSPPSNNGSYLTQFIEYQQYLKGSFFNEIGLSANYNMKREAIGKGESTLDEDSLLPLCDNMLLCRQEDMRRVNALFGTSIEVDFSSAWKENRIEAKLALLTMATGAGLSPQSTNATSGSEPIAESNDESTNDVLDSEESGQIGDQLGPTLDQSVTELDEMECGGTEVELDVIDEKVEEAINALEVGSPQSTNEDEENGENAEQEGDDDSESETEKEDSED